MWSYTKSQGRLERFGGASISTMWWTGAFVLKEDLTDFVHQNKHAIINSYRSQRDELLSENDWTQTEDCRSWLLSCKSSTDFKGTSCVELGTPPR